MKVIDVLNGIANGEEVPEYINYTHRVFGRDTMFVCKENIINKLDIGAIELNDEVEIIEEDKKIEKLESYISCGWSGTCKDLKRDDLFNDLKKIGNKINEIIDKLNEMEKE